jgi:hypothetical protein
VIAGLGRCSGGLAEYEGVFTLIGALQQLFTHSTGIHTPTRCTRVHTRELTSHSSTRQIKLCGVPPKLEEKWSNIKATTQIIVNHYGNSFLHTLLGDPESKNLAL